MPENQHPQNPKLPTHQQANLNQTGQPRPGEEVAPSNQCNGHFENTDFPEDSTGSGAANLPTPTTPQGTYPPATPSSPAPKRKKKRWPIIVLIVVLTPIVLLAAAIAGIKTYVHWYGIPPADPNYVFQNMSGPINWISADYLNGYDTWETNHQQDNIIALNEDETILIVEECIPVPDGPGCNQFDVVAYKFPTHDELWRIEKMQCWSPALYSIGTIFYKDQVFCLESSGPGVPVALNVVDINTGTHTYEWYEYTLNHIEYLGTYHDIEYLAEIHSNHTIITAKPEIGAPQEITLDYEAIPKAIYGDNMIFEESFGCPEKFAIFNLKDAKVTHEFSCEKDHHVEFYYNGYGIEPYSTEPEPNPIFPKPRGKIFDFNGNLLQENAHVFSIHSLSKNGFNVFGTEELRHAANVEALNAEGRPTIISDYPDWYLVNQDITLSGSEMYDRFGESSPFVTYTSADGQVFYLGSLSNGGLFINERGEVIDGHRCNSPQLLHEYILCCTGDNISENTLLLPKSN